MIDEQYLLKKKSELINERDQLLAELNVRVGAIGMVDSILEAIKPVVDETPAERELEH